MNSEEIKIIIKDTILECVGKKKKDITENTDLLAINIFDSITFVKLVKQLEKIFQIEFDIFDLSINNFKNIELISANVREKLELSNKEVTEEK
jgi:acyl carrier protein